MGRAGRWATGMIALAAIAGCGDRSSQNRNCDDTLAPSISEIAAGKKLSVHVSDVDINGLVAVIDEQLGVNYLIASPDVYAVQPPAINIQSDDITVDDVLGIVAKRYYVHCKKSNGHVLLSMSEQ